MTKPLVSESKMDDGNFMVIGTRIVNVDTVSDAYRREHKLNKHEIYTWDLKMFPLKNW